MTSRVARDDALLLAWLAVSRRTHLLLAGRKETLLTVLPLCVALKGKPFVVAVCDVCVFDAAALFCLQRTCRRRETESRAEVMDTVS